MNELIFFTLFLMFAGLIIFIFFQIGLTGYSPFKPKFKAGDLISPKGLEVWEKRQIKLIKTVGKSKYQFSYVEDGYMNGFVSDLPIECFDNLYELYKGPRDHLEFK